MSIPLDILISKDRNAYSMTCAVIKRADQITMAGEEDETVDHKNKIVSEAIEQVLTKKVKYQLEE